MKKTDRGVTLLEILMAMLVLGLVTGGIFTAFVFSRRVSWRAEGEILAQSYSSETAEELRLAVTGSSPSGLTLAPGIYVDQKLGNAGAFTGQTPAFIPPAGATALAGLNLPASFQTRYQTGPGTAATMAGHGDGRVMVVETTAADLDGDGQRGLDFNADGTTDMNRVRVKVRWTTPRP